MRGLLRLLRLRFCFLQLYIPALIQIVLICEVDLGIGCLEFLRVIHL